jgi:hypothetical protein
MNKLKWLWEFSKRLVVMCVVLYAIVQLYTMVVMAVSGDYSALPILNEQITDVLKTCVFGYFVKAGAENVVKIYQRKKNKEDGYESE